jgi:hypothetical protein
VVTISIYWKNKRIVLGKIVHGKKKRKNCPTIEKSVISIFKSKLIDKISISYAKISKKFAPLIGRKF